MPIFPVLLLLGLVGASRLKKAPTPPPFNGSSSPPAPAAAAPRAAASAPQPFAALAKATAAAKQRAAAPINPAEQAAVDAAVAQAVRDQGGQPPIAKPAPNTNVLPRSSAPRTPYDSALGLAAFLKKTGRFGSPSDRPAEIALAQQGLGVAADGIVGPQTRAAAAKAGVMLPPQPKAAAKAPSSAPAAKKRTPQEAATALRDFLIRTGRFGSKADRPAEVKAAQRDLGVAADGVVGPKTRAAASTAGVALPAK